MKAPTLKQALTLVPFLLSPASALAAQESSLSSVRAIAPLSQSILKTVRETIANPSKNIQGTIVGIGGGSNVSSLEVEYNGRTINAVVTKLNGGSCESEFKDAICPIGTLTFIEGDKVFTDGGGEKQSNGIVDTANSNGTIRGVSSTVQAEFLEVMNVYYNAIQPKKN